MKPKTSFQKQVYSASKYLPPITDKQVKWAYEHCLEHIGRRLKSGKITCLECNHSWTDKTTVNSCSCPNCAAKLFIYDTLKSKFTDSQYCCFLTTCKGFQVVRYINISIIGRVGYRPIYEQLEVVQHWIDPSGKLATFAKKRFSMYWDLKWCKESDFEIRKHHTVYNINPFRVHPSMIIIPKLKQCGFIGNIYEFTPLNLIQALLSQNRAETLFKAKEINLLKHFITNGLATLDQFWSSLKICFRNRYQISDVSIWCDYIELLRFFNKDLHNAKYVCPADLTAEHDKYVQKKRHWQKQQDREVAKIKASQDNLLFNKLKSRFFGIEFTDGLIQVRVLDSSEDVMLEGDALHHCLFTNEYHLKPDTLLFSAYIGDKRLETVEVSLSLLKVIQCRGACNQNTEYHSRIVKLVNKNVPQIQKRLSA